MEEGGPRSELRRTGCDAKPKEGGRQIRLACGSSGEEKSEGAACPADAGVALRERCGHPGAVIRSPDPLAAVCDMPAMSDIPDSQWCFPSRRQQAGVPAYADAKAIGATEEQPIVDSTKMASKRRIPNAT